MKVSVVYRLVVKAKDKIFGVERKMMIEKIKEIILKVAEMHGIEIDKIILFGSRARGDFREDSDWDILIVTKEKLDWRVRNEFYADVMWKLVNSGISPEVIIVSKEKFEKYRNLTGFVYYWAEREGIVML